MTRAEAQVVADRLRTYPGGYGSAWWHGPYHRQLMNSEWPSDSDAYG
jgi:hypothetical protein